MSKIPRELDRYPLLYEGYSRLGESRVVTVPLAYGDFSYTLLEPCDVDGTPKTYFKEGETVYFNIKGINNGTGDEGAIIVITDVETGEELKRIGTMVVSPGEEFSALAVLIGTMPDHDWQVKCEMTP